MEAITSSVVIYTVLYSVSSIDLGTAARMVQDHGSQARPVGAPQETKLSHEN